MVFLLHSACQLEHVLCGLCWQRAILLERRYEVLLVSAHQPPDLVRPIRKGIYVAVVKREAH